MSNMWFSTLFHLHITSTYFGARLNGQAHLHARLLYLPANLRHILHGLYVKRVQIDARIGHGCNPLLRPAHHHVRLKEGILQVASGARSITESIQSVT